MVLFKKTLFGLSVLLMALLSVVICSPFAAATYQLPGTTTFAKLVPGDESSFAQNQILFYDPSDCVSKRNTKCSSVSVFSELDEDDVMPTGKVDGSQITVIADSLVALTTEKLFNEYFEGADYGPAWNDCAPETGGTATSYVCSGKKATKAASGVGSGGFDILKGIIERGELRPILLFHLGANDGGWTQDMIDELLQIVDNKAQIVLVTNKFAAHPGAYDESNELLKKTAEEVDNVIVADWASLLKDECFGYSHPYDGLHIGFGDTSPCNRQFLRVMHDTIAKVGKESCSEGGLLSGDTIAEKTWNWLTERLNNEELSDVHIPAIVSGIMGNFYIESGINPFMAGSTAPYYGFHMWYYAYGGGDYVKKVNDTIGTNYFKFYGWWKDESDADKWLEEAGASTQDIDVAINANLEGIANGWGEFIDGIKNWGVADTARGYSDLFLVTMERAVNGESQIEDPAVASHYGGLYQGAAVRREKADYIYEKYASRANASGGSSGSKSNHISNDVKYSNSITWDEDGWLTGGMDGYSKEVPNLSLRADYQKYKSGKPNKILLHYTQGSGIPDIGVYEIPSEDGGRKSDAPHFSIDLLKKEVHQHYPLGQPSGASMDDTDVRDNIQIEIAGYGFNDNNPDNPDENSICKIGGADYTSDPYCFAKFKDEDWDYLAQLLVGINKWGKENGADIPLTTDATWTGDVTKVRMSSEDFDAARGFVAHMHGPADNHTDTGNIWPLVKAAIDRNGCSTSGDGSEISGAKNADKQATDVGKMWFSDNDTESMKTLLENYGDLAFRTGQAYDIPWVAILVQARYEDGGNTPDIWCGSNNAWGIACYNGGGHSASPGGGANYANLGEGFTGYGETTHNGNYEEALKYPDDPKKYIEALQGTWIGTGSKYGLEKSIDALQSYIDSPEGQAVVAKFGAANCSAGSETDECGEESPSKAKGDVASLQKLLLKLAWDTPGPGSGSAKQEYLDIMAKAPYKGGCGGQDCGAFVSTLVVESGWDPDYKRCYTACQVDYLEKSDKWKDVTKQIKSNSDAEPGDVIICHDGIFTHHCAGHQHVLIYVGKVNGFGGEMASASLCGRWPEAEGGDISGYVQSGFHIYRKVK